MKKIVAIVLVLIAVVIIVVISSNNRKKTIAPATTSKPIPTTKVVPKVTVYPVDSTITSELNKSFNVAGTIIKVVAITQDSRCPTGVQCIQAGKVVISVNIQSGSGSTNESMEPGQIVTTKNLIIKLLTVDPYPKSGQKISDSERRFSFYVRGR